MAGKRRVQRCPAGCNAGQIPKQQKAQRTYIDSDGKKQTETYTETVMYDCVVCDGSGQVVDFDG